MYVVYVYVLSCGKSQPSWTSVAEHSICDSGCRQTLVNVYLQSYWCLESLYSRLKVSFVAAQTLTCVHVHVPSNTCYLALLYSVYTLYLQSNNCSSTTKWVIVNISKLHVVHCTL